MSFVYDNRQKNEPGERRNDVSLKIHHSCIFSPSFSFRFVRILWPRSRSSNKTFCFRLTFYIMRILGRGKRCRSTPLKKYTHTHTYVNHRPFFPHSNSIKATSPFMNERSNFGNVHAYVGQRVDFAIYAKPTCTNIIFNVWT